MNNSVHSRNVTATLKRAGHGAQVNHPHTSRIVASWERCVERYGLEPYRVAFPTIVTRNELKTYQEQIEDLIAAAMPEVDRLFNRFVEHDYIVSMTDGNGVTVLFRSQDPQVGKCTNSGLMLGAIWSEEMQGTNGLGTCIAEAKPISIVMDNHFDERLVDFSCTVAPIFGDGGKVAAALNLSTSRPSDYSVQSIVGEVVKRSARRIENRYFARRHAGQELFRLSEYEDFSDAGIEMRMALDGSGRIIDATPDVLRVFARDNTSLIGEKLKQIVQPTRSHGEDSETSAIEVNGARLFVRRAETDKRSSIIKAVTRPLPKTQTQSPDIALLVGGEANVTEQVRRIQKLVDRQLPVLLQGETGSGKTALARALHAASARSNGPFVAINCAAIPPELIESELFGYKPGAFTGASKQGSKGRIAEADGGTLFLDEIGDMPLALQTRLLQVLSDGEFVAIGATVETKVRFSLISATLHNIEELVEKGRFRQDLFYRLNGAVLRMPSLRERSDREVLIERVFQEEGSDAGMANVQLDATVRKMLLAHQWPGNVRELRHVARFATTLAEKTLITLTDLPAPFNHPSALNAPDDHDDRRLVELALQQSGWNVKLAAERLGISRATLHRRITHMGLARERHDPRT